MLLKKGFQVAQLLQYEGVKLILESFQSYYNLLCVYFKAFQFSSNWNIFPFYKYSMFSLFDRQALPNAQPTSGSSVLHGMRGVFQIPCLLQYSQSYQAFRQDTRFSIRPLHAVCYVWFGFFFAYAERQKNFCLQAMISKSEVNFVTKEAHKLGLFKKRKLLAQQYPYGSSFEINIKYKITMTMV